MIGVLIGSPMSKMRRKNREENAVVGVETEPLLSLLFDLERELESKIPSIGKRDKEDRTEGISSMM